MRMNDAEKMLKAAIIAGGIALGLLALKKIFEMMEGEEDEYE